MSSMEFWGWIALCDKTCGQCGETIPVDSRYWTLPAGWPGIERPTDPICIRCKGKIRKQLLADPIANVWAKGQASLNSSGITPDQMQDGKRYRVVFEGTWDARYWAFAKEHGGWIEQSDLPTATSIEEIGGGS